MTPEAQARALLDEWLDTEPRAMRKLPDPLQTLQPRLAAALAQARREVWEEAANAIEDSMRPRSQFAMREQLIEWCRAQAQEDDIDKHAQQCADMEGT